MRLFGRSNVSSASGGAASKEDCGIFARCANKAQFVLGTTAAVFGLGIAATSMAPSAVPVATALVVALGPVGLGLLGAGIAAVGIYNAYQAYKGPSNSLDNKVEVTSRVTNGPSALRPA